MALFELEQHYENAGKEWKPPTFKDCAAADIDLAFFDGDEHAEMRTVDGKEVLVIFEDSKVKQHSAHWEAGAKQNFDTGIYTAYSILYIKVKDYGTRPKVDKQLVMGVGKSGKRTYFIRSCEEEAGVYRMILERSRQ